MRKFNKAKREETREPKGETKPAEHYNSYWVL